MKERGKIFNTEDVKAILDDMKTQFRMPIDKKLTNLFEIAADLGEVSRFMQNGFLHENDLSYIVQFCPYGQIGDRLYVKETFLIGEIESGYEPPHENEYTICNNIGGSVLYYADHIESKDVNNIIKSDKWDNCMWSPSVHMTKDLARIWLEITDIRVERENGVWVWVITFKRIEK